jgi:uncharacterized damage-inducible protein DinB
MKRRRHQPDNPNSPLPIPDMTDRRLQEAIRHFHPPTGFRPWHGGASPLGTLRGVSAELAAWRPAPDRHTIWEIALHIAYWNYAVSRRITQGPIGGFARSPSNWPLPESLSRKSWNTDRQLIRDTHEILLQALQSFDASQLDKPAGKNTRTTYADLITGIVLHDTYHTGQIQLLKRLAPDL